MNQFVQRLLPSVYASAEPLVRAKLDLLASQIEVEREQLRPLLGKASKGAFLQRDEVDVLSWEELLLLTCPL
jgi:hypothetical protein